MNKKVLNIKLPEKLLKDINNIAKEKNISATKLVIQILDNFLNSK